MKKMDWWWLEYQLNAMEVEYSKDVVNERNQALFTVYTERGSIYFQFTNEITETNITPQIYTTENGEPFEFPREGVITTHKRGHRASFAEVMELLCL